MKKLLIFPCGGNGIEALDCIGSNYCIEGFIDDSAAKIGKEVFGVKVYGREILEQFKDAYILAVPGNPNNYKKRKEIIDGLGLTEEQFATVIHPKANVSSTAKIGRNTLIMAGAVITSNAVIGDNVIILPNTVIHHDSVIGDNSLIGSNVVIAGGTEIGKNCYIGSGTNVINGIKIGDFCLIGMGSNVIKSLPERLKAVGNPAKSIGEA